MRRERENEEREGGREGEGLGEVEDGKEVLKFHTHLLRSKEFLEPNK